MRCDAVDQRYLADIASAAIFWNPIAGAGMSWLVYSMQKDRSGGCI